MKRACDASSLQEALKHGTLMVSELRTSLLSPKLYYELYMEVFDQLGFLEIFFTTLQRQGTPLSKIYEAVQLTGNVLPRLYLMITAGSVYIKSGQGRAREVLGDLLEMVKGVQHPQRGLFLRHYLAQKCKDRLPDEGSPYSGEFHTLLPSLCALLPRLLLANPSRLVWSCVFVRIPFFQAPLVVLWLTLSALSCPTSAR
jgi:vacuolar protein sorting-associated protein 35